MMMMGVAIMIQCEDYGGDIADNNGDDEVDEVMIMIRVMIGVMII